MVNGKPGPARKDECEHGHDMSPGSPNVGERPGKKEGYEPERYCKECHRRLGREHDERKRLSERMQSLRPTAELLDQMGERVLDSSGGLSGAAGLIAVQGWISA